MSIPDHPHTRGWFDLPDKAGKDLIAHAIRKIPGAGGLLTKLYSFNPPLGQGLQPHQYKSGGGLEWAYLNR